MKRDRARYSKTIGTLLGVALGRYAKSVCGVDECVVLLTREMAEHIVEIYYNTDWDSLMSEDNTYTIIIPEHIFSGEINEEEWYSHVGEYIYITRFGEPWNDIMDSETFVDGVVIKLLDDALTAAILDIDTLEDSREEMLYDWNLVANIMMKSGFSDAEMKLKVIEGISDMISI